VISTTEQAIHMSALSFAEENMMTTRDYERRINECKKVITDVPEHMQPEFARRSEQIQFG
jgi:hypothetical protein